MQEARISAEGMRNIIRSVKEAHQKRRGRPPEAEARVDCSDLPQAEFVPLKPPGIAMRDNLARARAYHAMPSWWGRR